MPIPQVDKASLSFRLKVTNAEAMAEHSEEVMERFRSFILAYDPNLTKGPLWLNVPFKDQHDWAVAQANAGGQYDPATFQTAYALAASEVFFLHGVDTGSGWDTSSGTRLPHPVPGGWGPTSLQAIPTGDPEAYYIWEYDNNTEAWVRVCYADFALVDLSGSATVSPEIVINNIPIATVGVSLAYGDNTTL